MYVQLSLYHSSLNLFTSLPTTRSHHHHHHHHLTLPTAGPIPSTTPSLSCPIAPTSTPSNSTSHFLPHSPTPKYLPFPDPLPPPQPHPTTPPQLHPAPLPPTPPPPPQPALCPINFILAKHKKSARVCGSPRTTTALIEMKPRPARCNITVVTEGWVEG
ncbi:hypothetical protein Pmani_018799 [Petrolisthes manimaculis]|uniref:Uncharacterized protein n=1 Tax=Petrolisthes manimaculis TaxID=1843537 RepID=A0AAE1U6B7_9EUCA|nr:hypothetical protein Pmani_018799 [Petrolisthes manimaculis]